MSETYDLEQLEQPHHRRNLIRYGVGAAAGAGALALGTAAPAAAVVSGGTYTSVTPIRLLDTRQSGKRISVGQTQTSTVLAGAEYCCVCSVTAVKTSGSGWLSFYSSALATRPDPYISLSWSAAGQKISNLVMFDTGSAGFKIYCGGGATDFLVDWVGYFTTASAKSASQLAFEERARRAAGDLAAN